MRKLSALETYILERAGETEIMMKAVKKGRLPAGENALEELKKAIQAYVFLAGIGEASIHGAFSFMEKTPVYWHEHFKPLLKALGEKRDPHWALECYLMGQRAKSVRSALPTKK